MLETHVTLCRPIFLIEFYPIYFYIWVYYTIKQDFSASHQGGDPEIRRVLRAALDEEKTGEFLWGLSRWWFHVLG